MRVCCPCVCLKRMCARAGPLTPKVRALLHLPLRTSSHVFSVTSELGLRHIAPPTPCHTHAAGPTQHAPPCTPPTHAAHLMDPAADPAARHPPAAGRTRLPNPTAMRASSPAPAAQAFKCVPLPLWYCRCHQGDCSSCRMPVTKSCRCGKMTREVLCGAELLCDRRCTKMRNCGRHPCK